MVLRVPSADMESAEVEALQGRQMVEGLEWGIDVEVTRSELDRVISSGRGVLLSCFLGISRETIDQVIMLGGGGKVDGLLDTR